SGSSPPSPSTLNNAERNSFTSSVSPGRAVQPSFRARGAYTSRIQRRYSGSCDSPTSRASRVASATATDPSTTWRSASRPSAAAAPPNADRDLPHLIVCALPVELLRRGLRPEGEVALLRQFERRCPARIAAQPRRHQWHAGLIEEGGERRLDIHACLAGDVGE